MLALENKVIKVCLDAQEGLSVWRKDTGLKVSQQPSDWRLDHEVLVEDAIRFDVNHEGFRGQATLRLVGEREISLKLCSDGECTEPVEWPPAWTMKPGDLGIYPLGTGVAVPVEELDFPLREYAPLYCGMTACMGLFGFQRGKACVLTGIECGNDAELHQVKEGGLRHTQIRWLGAKGQWAYDRSIRFFFADSLAEGTRMYRAWRQQLGQVVTLKEKIRHTPEVAKLIGAADIWLWDDNNMNRLYGRPEEPVRTERKVRQLADEMEALGMTSLLWNSFEGETPEDCSYLKSKGFLVGKYDIYRDVLPKPDVDKIIPYRVKRSVNTKYWPDIVAKTATGEYRKAWQLHGLDGQMHYQNAVCDIAALKLTMENVPPDVERVGYTSRLMDVQAGAALQECYHPMHPATRSDSARYINTQLRFLGDIGLVTGVEVGGETTVGSFHYSEGMLSPLPFRAEDAGRRMTTQYAGEDIPPTFTKYMLNPSYRIPLWDLVYHDCVVTYWYWGDSSNCCLELMPLRDLFDALYGLPPLYSLTATQWQTMKHDIAQSYKRATKTARLTALAPMISFECLTDDRKVQKTTFANGITVIANFSDRIYATEEGRYVAPLDYLVVGEENLS